MVGLWADLVIFFVVGYCRGFLCFLHFSPCLVGIYFFFMLLFPFPSFSVAMTFRCLNYAFFFLRFFFCSRSSLSFCYCSWYFTQSHVCPFLFVFLFCLLFCLCLFFLFSFQFIFGFPRV